MLLIRINIIKSKRSQNKHPIDKGKLRQNSWNEKILSRRSKHCNCKRFLLSIKKACKLIKIQTVLLQKHAIENNKIQQRKQTNIIITIKTWLTFTEESTSICKV